jgi:hypothetical protein
MQCVTEVQSKLESVPTQAGHESRQETPPAKGPAAFGCMGATSFSDVHFVLRQRFRDPTPRNVGPTVH